LSLFHKARRTDSRLRLALLGPAGSGKTFTSLRVGHAMLAPGERLAVIDTEHASSNLYASESNPDGGRFDFDVLDLAAMPGSGRYSVDKYLAAIRAAAEAGYPVLVIDSLSHAWAGEGGLLDYVNERTQRSRTRNGLEGWREATPLHNRLVEAILGYPGHVITTMRTKVQWVVEKDEKGQSVPRKVGLQPIQREGLDYEFTVVADVDPETHTLVVRKTRCPALADRAFPRAGADLADVLTGWLAGAEACYDLRAFEADCASEGYAADEVAWFVEERYGNPPWALNSAQLSAVMEQLRTSGGRERLVTAVEGLRDRFRRTLFARLGKLELDDARRRELVQAWYDVDSVRDVAVRAIVAGPRGIAWLRGVKLPQLREAVIEALATSETTA